MIFNGTCPLCKITCPQRFEGEPCRRCQTKALGYDRDLFAKGDDPVAETVLTLAEMTEGEARAWLTKAMKGNVFLVPTYMRMRDEAILHQQEQAALRIQDMVESIYQTLTSHEEAEHNYVNVGDGHG